jgi:hypothetical protein
MAAPVHVAMTHGLIQEDKLECRLLGNKLLIAFTRITLFQVLSHENWVLASLCVLNHLGVTTMKRLDQGHLHPN